MYGFLIPSFILFLFSIFNLIGVRKDLVTPQLIAFGISLILFFVIKKIGLSFFRRNAAIFYWIFVVLLAITYIIGLEAKGSKRWIDLFVFNFQPSEFFKPFFVIYIADYFTKHLKNLDISGIFFRIFFLSLLPIFIIFRQPDLGSSMVYLAMFLSLLLTTGIPKKYIVLLITVIFICIPTGWLLLKGYQRERLINFLNPSADLRGGGYNMLQAVITIGSGQFSGRGLGFGTQTKLRFLPENHTDFAFASIVEQFGFVGGIIIIILYGIISYLILSQFLYYYRKKYDEDAIFKRLVTIGVFTSFIFQVLVNLLMNMGLFPITGITLPLVSYGGSSLLSIFMGFALIP